MLCVAGAGVTHERGRAAPRSAAGLLIVVRKAEVCLLPLMRLEAFPPFSLAARKEVWRLKGVIGSSFCRRAGARLDDQSRADVRLALAAVTA